MSSKRFPAILLTTWSLWLGATVAVTNLAGVSGSADPLQSFAEAGLDQRSPADQVLRGGVTYVRVDVTVTANGVPVLDLSERDFEVREDGDLQTIAHFRAVRVKDSTEAGSDSVAVPDQFSSGSEPRPEHKRKFVLLLDVFHTSLGPSRSVSPRLAHTVDAIVGSDDLLALMIPTMGVADLTFTSKADAIARILSKAGDWGERFGFTRDAIEKR